MPLPWRSHNLLEQWSLGIKLQCENVVLIKNYCVLYTLKYSRLFMSDLQLLVQPFLNIYLSHKPDPPITSHSFIFCGYPDFFWPENLSLLCIIFLWFRLWKSSSKSQFECLLCQEFHLPSALLEILSFLWTYSNFKCPEDFLFCELLPHVLYMWKWSCSVMSDSLGSHGLQPPRLHRPWDFPGKSTGVGCHKFLYFWCIESGYQFPSLKDYQKNLLIKQS